MNAAHIAERRRMSIHIAAAGLIALAPMVAGAIHSMRLEAERPAWALIYTAGGDDYVEDSGLTLSDCKGEREAARRAHGGAWRCVRSDTD